MKRRDANGDGRISVEEWHKKKRTFEDADENDDGYLSIEELYGRYGGPVKKTKKKEIPKRAAKDVNLNGQVSVSAIDNETLCGIGRSRDCSIKIAIKLGMFETGLRPRFPKGLKCRDIDEQWAISYTHKRGRENYHGGIDMPAPYGTPMIAAADGTVVSRTRGEKTFRGIEMILRHSPKDTGLPMWTYTQYAHFDEMPKQQVGERVKMGEELGPTGNTGIGRSGRQNTRRRPAIHFAVWFSDSPEFALARSSVIVPLKGLWMDPNALYRKKPPFDSTSLKALPANRKKVPIPVMTDEGKFIPADTKLVWPYRCKRK